MNRLNSCLSNLLDPLADAMEEVQKAICDINDVSYPPLAEMVHYVFEQPGKQIRPALVLLATKLRPVNFMSVVSLAAAVETLHSATLIHDDLVDESSLRRGRKTVNTFWGAGATVLAGDYIFARSAAFMVATGSLAVVRLFSEALKALVDGELRQSFASRRVIPSREDYLFRIRCKTASLFALSTEASGALVGAPTAEVDALKAYGLNIGLAFQIVDDIQDLVGSERDLGKPVRSDLQKGTITLPVCYFSAAQPEHPALRSYLSSAEPDEEVVTRLANAICESGAVRQTLADATYYALRAVDVIEKVPDFPGRATMRELATVFASEHPPF